MNYVDLASDSLVDLESSSPIAPCPDRDGVHRGCFAAYHFICPFGTPLAALWRRLYDWVGAPVRRRHVLRSTCSPQFGIVVSEPNEAL